MQARYFEGITSVPTPWFKVEGNDRVRLINNVLDFGAQQFASPPASSSDPFAAIATPMAQTRSAPGTLAPYCIIEDALSWAAQRALWSDTPRQSSDGVPVEPVIALAPALLRNGLLIQALARYVPEAERIWLVLPEIRSTVVSVQAATISWHVRWLIEQLSRRTRVGLLQASFEAAAMAGPQLAAIGFATHLSDPRLAKGSSRGSTYGYVTAVHGWAEAERVRTHLSDLRSVEEVWASFCGDSNCLQLFEKVGPEQFARLLFEPPNDGDIAPHRIHTVRARPFELDLLARTPFETLPDQLVEEARRSPFEGAAIRLSTLAYVLRKSRDQAA